jgi:Asp-tRNA(Asn)/Glu-tRNA(Gln) amidotransferase A subunit family amidase
VVGLKPAFRELPIAGVFPLCPSFDTVGPMTRMVEDCALAYGVLSGAPGVGERDLGGLRAGLLTAMPPLAPGGPEPAYDERALELGERLAALGVAAEEVALPVPEADIWPLFYREAAAVHRETFPARAQEYGPTIRAKLELARHTDPAAADAARSALEAWRAAARVQPAVDVIASPTLGVREIPPSDVNELEIRVAFSGYTRAFSFLGWPAIAIGQVQLAARDVQLLFAVALAWERAYGPPGPA